MHARLGLPRAFDRAPSVAAASPLLQGNPTAAPRRAHCLSINVAQAAWPSNASLFFVVYCAIFYNY
jgi:hypothetical protein